MNKLAIVTFFVFIIVQSAFSQDDWITLRNPLSGILGAPIKEIVNNDLNFDLTLKYDKHPMIDTSESTESSIEYADQFNNFVTQFFDKKKITIRATKAYDLKVRSLSQTAIDNLQIGCKYVYEGIAADSVEITLSAKKEFSTDVSRAIKDISAAITNPAVTKIVEKISPLLDSISYTKHDSICYLIKIKNPNVYYKIKVIKLIKNGNSCGCDWEKKCFLYFVDKENGEFPNTIRLKSDFSDDSSTTISRYPEFCGEDRSDVQFFLKVEKDNQGLHLWVYASSADVSNSAKPLMEVPYKDENGIRKWRLNRTFLYRFENNGVIKNVYIAVSAIQFDSNSLDVLNWKTGKNSYAENALTYLKYPEFTVEYEKQ